MRAALTGSVGFVPTMGFLHDGHLSLAQAAREQNQHVVASIFVNPAQFGPNEDLAQYPRDIERDVALLSGVGTDFVFIPRAGEIYPDGFSTSVDVGPLAAPLEGLARPGHFQGVATVVLKLFNIIQPAKAYFGRKDGQQLAVIQRLVRDLNLPIEVVAMPTIRESSGLAMSTRNAYLTPEQREAAPVLWQTLLLAQEMWIRGVRDAEAIRDRALEYLSAEPLAKLEYISIADPETFAELDRIRGQALVSLAVRVGDTRLIDNVLIGD